MSAHTPGLLAVDKTGEYLEPAGVTDIGVAHIMSMDQGGDKGWFHGPITKANLRRLAACWNACDGLPTELLEKHGVTRSGIAKGVQELTEQRDEMLAELRECRALLASVESCSRNNFANLAAERVQEIDAAIVKIGGAA